MPTLRLTTHFGERWAQRVGSAQPTPKEIDALIRESIQLQKPRDLFTPRGYRFRVMAMFWHPGRGLVFKVDAKRNRVVTVLTPQILDGVIEE